MSDIKKKSEPLSVKCTDPQSYSCSPTQILFFGGIVTHVFIFLPPFVLLLVSIH